MKLLYVSDSRMPSDRANSIQIAKTCEALAKIGWDVTLLLPNRAENKEKADEDVWAYYNIKTRFKIDRVPVVDAGVLESLGMSGLWFIASTGSFALSVLKYVKKNRGFNVIYSRHEPSVALLSRLGLGIPTVFEAHKFSRVKSRMVGRASGIVAITKGLADAYSPTVSCPIIVAPDAVDIGFIEDAPSREKAREVLDLDARRRIVVYTGQLFPWKGVETLIAAARLLPGTQFVIVGGSGKRLAELRCKAPQNVALTGQVPNKEIPTYLSAADIFALPNTAERISQEFTSPLKLFEYMAASRPIVASDLQSLREVLSNEMAFFFKSEDPASLAATITKALSADGAVKARRARKEVERYTWDRRAEAISVFLKRLSK